MAVKQQTRHLIEDGNGGSLSLEIVPGPWETDGEQRFFRVQVTALEQGEELKSVSIECSGPLQDFIDLLHAEGLPVDDGERSAKAYNDGQVRALDDLCQAFADRRDEQRIGIGTLRTMIDDEVDHIRGIQR